MDRPPTPVLGVPDQDHAVAGLADFDAASTTVAAEASLPPAEVIYTFHLSSATFSIRSCEAPRGSGVTPYKIECYRRFADYFGVPDRLILNRLDQQQVRLAVQAPDHERAGKAAVRADAGWHDLDQDVWDRPDVSARWVSWSYTTFGDPMSRCRTDSSSTTHRSGGSGLAKDGLPPDPRGNQIRQSVSIYALALANEQRFGVFGRLEKAGNDNRLPDSHRRGLTLPAEPVREPSRNRPVGFAGNISQPDIQPVALPNW